MTVTTSYFFGILHLLHLTSRKYRQFRVFSCCHYVRDKSIIFVKLYISFPTLQPNTSPSYQIESKECTASCIHQRCLCRSGSNGYVVLNYRTASVYGKVMGVKWSIWERVEIWDAHTQKWQVPVKLQLSFRAPIASAAHRSRGKGGRREGSWRSEQKKRRFFFIYIHKQADESHKEEVRKQCQVKRKGFSFNRDIVELFEIV